LNYTGGNIRMMIIAVFLTALVLCIKCAEGGRKIEEQSSEIIINSE